MIKKSRTPSKTKKRKVVEEKQGEEEEDEEVDIVGGLAEAPQSDEAGTSTGGKRKRKKRSDEGQPRMKVKAIKMKNKERYVLVNAGWKKLDPKEVIISILDVYLMLYV